MKEKFLPDRPHPCSGKILLTRMLTRDLFAVANLTVVIVVTCNMYYVCILYFTNVLHVVCG